MEATLNFVSLAPFLGLAGFLFALSTFFWVLKQPAGNAKMVDISGLILEKGILHTRCIFGSSYHPIGRQIGN